MAASCSRVMLAFGENAFAPVPFTMPSLDAQLTAAA